ncbi:GNAT family N-acetyltransferase [Arcticibacter tournemirensis]|uniref:GNAT family N-acetyltransferase n=1 Tax=Arcticibacter tournemirensis TaxID=699437 RepID=A0A5M9HGT7_9SPHI|nr:GNAT family N-acetyltransferase [Arcticibacter tournemirensis]
MQKTGDSKWEIDRIFARPFHSNLASQKFLLKAGFTKEAELKQTLFKNGRYYNELIFRIRRSWTISSFPVKFRNALLTLLHIAGSNSALPLPCLSLQR